MKTTTLLLTCLAALLLNHKARAATVLFDSPPFDTTWYQSGYLNMSFSETTGLTVNGSTANTITYFTNNRSQFQNLAVGDSIELTFNLTATNPQASYNGMFFGLMSSNGSQLLENYYGNSTAQATVEPFSGYLAMLNLGNNPSGYMYIYERKKNSGYYSLYNGNSLGDYAQEQPAANLTSGTAYPVSLKVTRTGSSENTIVMTINNQTTTLIHTGTDFFAFDSINFGYQTNGSDSLTFDDIKVSFVPEPGSDMLLLSALAFFGMFQLSRRSRRKWCQE